MSTRSELQTVILESDIQPRRSGFHSILVNVVTRRSGSSHVTVLISVDACRKALTQLAGARVHQVGTESLVHAWATWQIEHRLKTKGNVPSVITIMADDLDGSGLYAAELGKRLKLV